VEGSNGALEAGVNVKNQEFCNWRNIGNFASNYRKKINHNISFKEKTTNIFAEN
jgi:hypothetical protein